MNKIQHQVFEDLRGYIGLRLPLTDEWKNQLVDQIKRRLDSTVRELGLRYEVNIVLQRDEIMVDKMTVTGKDKKDRYIIEGKSVIDVTHTHIFDDNSPRLCTICNRTEIELLHQDQKDQEDQ